MRDGIEPSQEPAVLAAVDRNGRTSDKGSLLRAKKSHERAKVVRRADSSSGQCAPQRTQVLPVQAAETVGRVISRL
jgi:hypothetical protein